MQQSGLRPTGRLRFGEIQYWNWVSLISGHFWFPRTRICVMDGQRWVVDVSWATVVVLCVNFLLFCVLLIPGCHQLASHCNRLCFLLLLRATAVLVVALFLPPPCVLRMVFATSLFAVVVAAVVGAATAAPSNGWNDNINWVSLADASAAAQASGKPIMNVIHKSWCVLLSLLLTFAWRSRHARVRVALACVNVPARVSALTRLRHASLHHAPRSIRPGPRRRVAPAWLRRRLS